MKRILTSLFLLSQFFFWGCVSDDYSKIDTSVTLRPNYSIPLGVQTTVVPQPPSIISPPSIILQDTIAYSFENLFKNSEIIESIMFRVQTTNSYPATAVVNAFYYDTNGVLLGSLTKDNPVIVTAQNIDSINGTTSVGQTIGDYYFNVDEFELLKRATQIIIVTEFQDVTLSQPLLNNWSSFSVVTTVGLQVQINRQS